MTRLPFLDRSKLRGSSRAGAGARENLPRAKPYPVDRALEYLLSKRGKENVALFALAFSSIAGIYLIGRYG